MHGGDLLPRGPDLLRLQREFIREVLAPHAETLRAAGREVLIIPGNDDPSSHDELLDEVMGAAGARLIDRRKAEVDGWEFIGFDLVSDTPFRLKDRCRMDRRGAASPVQKGGAVVSTPGGLRDLPDWPGRAAALPTIEEELGALPLPADPARAVYVIHVPPAGLGLDRCADGREGGSRAVHGFLRKVAPRVSLHGHIHESPEMTGLWCTRLGSTLAVQPGSRAALVGVVVDLQARSAVLRTREAAAAGRG